MKLVTAQEMQEIDRRTIEGGHVSSLTLMENAGRAVTTAVLQRLRGIGAPRVEILCGKGNNGGDGLVAARLLATSGVDVRVWLTSPGKDLSPDSRHNLQRLSGRGVDVREPTEDITDPGPVASARERTIHRAQHESLGLPLDATTDLVTALRRSDLCLDALLGTGVNKPLAPRLAAFVNTMNRSCREILAVDMPSGVDGTSGEVHGTSVWAESTVTMGLPKMGLVFHPGAERTGRLLVADIGFPLEIVESIDTSWAWMGRETARRVLPDVTPTAHKYARGALLVVAGSRAYPGAAALAAEAGLRCGAGIVHLVVPEGIRGLLDQQLREVIVHGVAETSEGAFHPDALDSVLQLLPRMHAVAVGPGIGDAEATHRFTTTLLDRLACPHVVDADALQAVGSERPSTARVVTPHAGELARMTTRKVERVVRQRVEVGAELARQRGIVVVCKGAPTVVALPDGRRMVNGSGNAGLATAGSGDVLTGVLGGLLAQGAPAGEAAALAAWLHGRAAEIASRRHAGRSLIAGDLLATLGEALAEITAI